MPKGPNDAMKCEEVIRELSNYLDEGVAPALRLRIENHLRGCTPCADLSHEVAGTIQILADESLLEVPPGYSTRLYSKVERHWSGADAIARASEIPLGIGEDSVPLGSHLIYFWQTADEFERGVGFLYPGL